jgi:hypothetical protein
VGPQHGRFGILGINWLDQVVPQEAGRPQHGDLHEKIHADTEEKAQPRGEGVNVHPAAMAARTYSNPSARVKAVWSTPVGAGFHHVVAADADRVELGHVLGAVGDDVRNDAHGGHRRIDVGVSGQVFFKDVVLDRSG